MPLRVWEEKPRKSVKISDVAVPFHSESPAGDQASLLSFSSQI